MTEKRKHKRYNQNNLPFEHYDVMNIQDNKVYGRIIDISEGGVKLETITSIEVGTRVSAKIELPYKYLSKTAISVDIVCRWCKEISPGTKYEAGFEFIDKSAIDTIFMMKILGLSKKERIVLTLLGAPLNL
ncbi:MAG: hypothetical protein A2Y40_06795 [Candidatus Margulisbacteria bacterium GWF2_35_9]|nr:MAG: hypothetical protein A2Y40_06795 [Candidatus Margulisbacteria bacterium GWF2_35_9]